MRLEDLTPEEEIGRFFRQVHDSACPVSGLEELEWDGRERHGADRRPPEAFFGVEAQAFRDDDVGGLEG